MNYNDKWSRENHIEYRKLKRSGYTDEMLIEHFGENIYHSGIYNKKSTIMPWLNFITEIIITPEKTNYNINKKSSDIYPNKIDYVINFNENDEDYIISMIYYEIENIKTYNILLTTEKQWNEYLNKIEEFRYKGYITDEERTELISIVEKETNYNQIYSVMKKVSYVLFDFIKNNFKNFIISIGEIKNTIKINLYRSIIKNSFKYVNYIGHRSDIVGNKYFIYIIE